MRFKSLLAKPYAGLIVKDIKRWAAEPLRAQEYWFNKLVLQGRKTRFGRNHDLANVSTYPDFIKRVPLCDYEGFQEYIDAIKHGEKDMLWPGKPVYFAKSSGTTSGIKYIPITADSVPNHINTARNALLMYISETGNARFTDGKMIFLSGSPELEKTGDVLTGRLSGIVNHHVPKYLRGNQLPSYETNCIDDWETKVARIVEETKNQNLTLVSGIPPWVQMYFDVLLEATGKKTVLDVFPNLQLLAYGGVNFSPYRDKLFSTIGRKIDSIETYPASEGFIAYQDTQKEAGLLLNVDSGIFFEFIPAAEIDNSAPTRLRLHDVELDKQYAIVLTTNAGLWGYVIGDTVKFVSKNPYRLLVTGRTKHFISAFGEHVIAEEVEQALAEANALHAAEVIEFTVAPQVTPTDGLPYHEWFIAFAKPPSDFEGYRHDLDHAMQRLNIYYTDLIEGKILQPLVIRSMATDAFQRYMKSQGRLGGQNKLPRLRNDREIADALHGLIG
ncbi:MAG TPA: GH3 auxin-responsive promoter family protein [Chitinophagales bacterium]|nr:GH3 auxin-responsive promoter family protein [Chitinophagales bacterium]